MAMTLITTNTSSNAATSDFNSSIDNTYKLYIFKFIDVNPATDNTNFTVQFNAAGQSGYNETITSTYFSAERSEAGSSDFQYVTSADQAQGTGIQRLMGAMSSTADESGAGEFWLFNPSNTTYVKHWYSRCNNYNQGDISEDCFAAGYINTTSAIDEIQFSMSSDNLTGTIKMYGVG